MYSNNLKFLARLEEQSDQGLHCLLQSVVVQKIRCFAVDLVSARTLEFLTE